MRHALFVMKTVIIALPVHDDVEIYDVAERMNEAFPHEFDAEDCVVFESVDALIDNLGWTVNAR